MLMGGNTRSVRRSGNELTRIYFFLSDTACPLRLFHVSDSAIVASLSVKFLDCVLLILPQDCLQHRKTQILLLVSLSCFVGLTTKTSGGRQPQHPRKNKSSNRPLHRLYGGRGRRTRKRRLCIGRHRGCLRTYRIAHPSPMREFDRSA